MFSFIYPNYVIAETANSIRMSVLRTGGGFGPVTISYFIRHITTNDSDLIATAHYTTSQTLFFQPGWLLDHLCSYINYELFTIILSSLLLFYCVPGEN